MSGMPTDPIADVVRAVADDPDVRVLERARLKPSSPSGAEHCRKGLVVDVVSAGTDSRLREAVSVAVLPFTYAMTGRVVAADRSIQFLNEPGRPLTADAERRTGITNAMLAGRGIDADEVDQAIGDASIVVAYGAEAARPLLEPLCHRFAILPWGCAQAQVPWGEEGFGAGDLDALLLQHDLFADAGRPVERCEAVLCLLARTLPKRGSTGLATLLASARQPGFRIWALGATAACRDLLSASGYAWNNGGDGRHRGWFKDSAPESLAAEQDFLTSFWFDGAVEPRIQVIDALNRFSERA